MIIERTENPQWLSNAYLVAEGPGGSGVLIDGNAVVDDLLDRVERDDITITHVLCTHHHSDHVADLADYRERFGVPVLGHELTARELGDGAIDETIGDGDVVRSGSLEIQAIATPGHCADHLAFLVNGEDVFTADCLFKGTVGGTMNRGSYEDIKHSIMERLLTLPPETRVHPGHREPTTVGNEWDSNPFVRVWRGLDPEGSERCRVRGRDATLILWGPDYDGTHKAWVRFPDGDAIVGGSQVERL
jgi:hydroxyacylglutathione hydrolase